MRHITITLVSLIMALSSAACGRDQTPEPTRLPEPTHTRYPTYTPYPTYTRYPTHTHVPAQTPAPTETPTPRPTNTITPSPSNSPTNEPTTLPTIRQTSTLTPLPVVSLGQPIQTDNIVLTLSGAQRINTLPFQDQTLTPAGQWIIAYGRAHNPTLDEASLFSHNFVLTASARSGYIFAHEQATAAAEQLAGTTAIIAGPIGSTIQPGATVPIAVAFDAPDPAGHLTLWIVNARTGIDLGPAQEIAPLETPAARPSGTPTGTPMRTPSATLTSTAAPLTATPRPTSTPTAEPTNTPTPRPTGTPTNTPTTGPAGTPTGTPTNTPTPRPTGIPIPAGATQAQLVSITDGDTIDVRINGSTETVRYIGIDTPERGQPGYRAATEANRVLLGTGPLYLVRDQTNRDRSAGPFATPKPPTAPPSRLPWSARAGPNPSNTRPTPATPTNSAGSPEKPPRPAVASGAVPRPMTAP